MTALTQRDRRIVMLATPFLIATLAIGKGAPRLRAWEADRIALASETHDRVRRLERDAATFTAVRDSLPAWDSTLARLQATLVHGRTTDAAAAAFAALLERIADEQNVALLTVTLAPDSVVRSGFARVAARLSGETDVNGLMDLLYAIESHAAPMLVRELVVSQPDPMAPASRPETLRLDLAVQTLARIDTVGGRNRGTKRNTR